jgi:hypothetical protein
VEHKLITGGGEQYLPFARSRIKALRAVGMRYASQRFIMPDGTVAVQIVGEQEYIRISGGGCLLEMDSGIVDLNEVFGYNDGVLYETAHALAYNSPFVPTVPVSEWRVNPNKASGQISGSVRRTSGFEGKVPYDGKPARSFSAGTEQLTAEWSRIAEDENLVDKKQLVNICPASIFTGRCRMYVQAIYGRPIYTQDGNNDGVFSSSGDPIARPTTPGVGNAAPALEVRSYEGGTLRIDTSTGVYLDVKGKHWLIKPTRTSVDIYPLKAGSCGESMRRHLIERAPASSDYLNGEDREHLEAYVLSTCRPVVSKMQSISVLGGLPHAWSMGYGWHWNWTGLTADIVVTEGFVQTPAGLNPETTGMRSTHHRIQLAHRDALTWEVTASIVEGPTDWTVDRLYWCLTEPLWTAGLPSKMTPRWTEPFDCDAPFYAFYRRDELQVCRVKVETKTPVAYKTEMDPPEFAAGLSYLDDGYNTLGLLGGWFKDVTGTGDYLACTIKVGTLEYSGLSRTRLASGRYREIRDKAMNGSYGPVTRDFIAYTFCGGYNFYSGYPRADGSYYSEYILAVSNNSSVVGVTYTYEVANLHRTESGIATVIVPTGDAEAIFVSTTITEWERRTSRVGEDWYSFVNPSWALRSFAETVAGPVGACGRTDVAWFGPDLFQYFWHRRGTPYGDSYTSSTPLADTSDTEISVVENNHLICGAGVVEATFGNISLFHNEAIELVGEVYQCISSVKGTVLSARTEPINANNNDPEAAALVGWA